MVNIKNVNTFKFLVKYICITVLKQNYETFNDFGFNTTMYTLFELFIEMML